jgi:CBS domain-containing protein
MKNYAKNSDKRRRGMTVKHLLEQKSQSLWTIDPDATVLDALAKMAEKDIGSLLVMDGEKLIGIITERHYSRNVVLKGKRSPTTLVSDIMERNVVHVRPEQSVELCMALMTDKRVRHLPVLEDNRAIGIVSIGDILKSIISKQKFVIDELEHYIRG